MAVGDIIVPYCHAKLYKRIGNLCNKTYRLINGRKTHFTVSVGVAEYPENGESALGVIKNAEIAVFEVKKNGKNNICYFNNEMYSDFLDALRIERQLSAAIDNEDFLLLYQPQYDTRTNKRRGEEAQDRWKKNGTIVQPKKKKPGEEK
ncbi:hypothetical protein CG709_16310, partial [Lachnotalea glycerini]